ncbi:MAG: hypothetical protein ACYDHU_01055 [Acidimicrobiales bacterium]
MKRPVWLAAGVVLGAGGALWAEARVRRELRRMTDRIGPHHVVNQTVSSARRVGERVRDAVEVGRVERDRRESELWSDLGAEGRTLSAGSAGRRRQPGKDGR